MEALLLWLTARLPVKVIKDGETPYLERYFVGCALGRTWYLHRFVASDPDRGLHDHPWLSAISFVLVGWYLEETRLGVREVRWFNRITGDKFHRVVLPTNRPVWTLFGHDSKKHVKGWGFLRPRFSWPGALIYVPHVDKDASTDSAAWVATAPKGRELRQ